MENMAENPKTYETDLCCKGCNRVFSTLKDLQIHAITCVIPVRGASFSTVWSDIVNGIKKRNEEKGDTVSEGKVALPNSQPNSQDISEKYSKLVDPVATGANKNEAKNSQKNPATCNRCQRTFDSIKGLRIHSRKCDKTASSESNSKSCAKTKQPDQDVQPELFTQTTQEAGHERGSTQQNIAEITQDEVQPTGSFVWGNLNYTEVAQIGNSMYEEIVFWKKNLFKLPTGAAGKEFLREITRLLNLWIDDVKPMGEISLKMVMVMPAILLQKPSRKSTSRQHSEYLRKRLQLWRDGKFDELMVEARAIQNSAKRTARKDESSEHLAKTFANLMLRGKVHAALRLLDKHESLGVAKLSETTLEELRKLHPQAHEARAEDLMTGPKPFFDPVIFENIDESSISKAAIRTRGAAGPSGMDADGWRRILVSKNYGNVGKDLRKTIARLTKSLCTNEIIDESRKNSLEAYLSNRLIPLEKAPSGVRPIGIGEVLRRIVGKAIVAEIKPELAEAAGCLQLCAGQKAGCEAAAHAMRSIYEEEETDAVLLVDASNAFNSLNRKVLLNNIQYVCPVISTYVRNCYGKPSRLFIAGGEEIASAEGTTQGDPMAMDAYAMGILPFLSLIKPEEMPELMKHVAYADDLAGGSKLEMLREWWEKIVQNGPAVGYYPKPSKSWLIVKEEHRERAEEIFKNTGINITTDGKKYLGGYVGTAEGSASYVEELVDDWVEQLKVLTSIAKTEPQAAYSGFTAGFKHKMTYFIRTIPNLTATLKPLDEAVANEFIPAITEGHHCSENERKLLSLPVRLGGLGLPIFSELCEREYDNSQKATRKHIEKIQALWWVIRG